ncbi:hypothetical protein [Clostridium ljungdahlii]|uniref:hypothetical protein n=1 Tax=Clostridium ljungdahlii TaxID=1538 RepID=UPI001FA71B46|nr:hypothetical protein [Clostridium ljungdahlii]
MKFITYRFSILSVFVISIRSILNENIAAITSEINKIFFLLQQSLMVPAIKLNNTSILHPCFKGKETKWMLNNENIEVLVSDYHNPKEWIGEIKGMNAPILS